MIKLMDILREVLNPIHEVIVYRGGGDTPTKRNLKYYTPDKKYAEWFLRHASYGDTGRMETLDVDETRFLDLRDLGYKFTPQAFLDRLNSVGLDTSKIFNWDEEARKMLTGVWDSWQIVTDDKNIWDQINKKYDGVIIKERNPEARHLGVVDSYLIWED